MGKKRIENYEGKFALVDGIHYTMPVKAKDSPAIIVGFSCDWEKVNALIPGNEIHALKLPNGKGAIIITVINYVATSIGKYIEYSIAVACTHGSKPAPKILNTILMKTYGTGQYILDLPVSSEVSVKGGKGIWGMPKHKANLDFITEENTISCQYEKDGQFAFRIELDFPKSVWLKLKVGTTNYCRFRNMLMASYIYFETKAGINLFSKAKARLFIGDHPKVAMLRSIDLSPDPFFSMYMPKANGILDDHFDTWFMTYDEPPAEMPEDFNSVINLGLSEEWLKAPSITDYQKYKI